MAELETLSVKLESDTSDYSDGLDTAKKKTSSFSDMASGALMGVGMAGVNMALDAGKALAGFAMDGIDMASDLNETMSKVGVVFGDNAKEINDWAATAATKLGQTKGEAMGAAATFGNLFVSMGMGTDSSADMSKSLVELAADLGSFNNMGTDEVLEKLKAGMLGSAEPMTSLGVNMNAAAINAKALSLGLVQADVDMNKVEAAQLALTKAQIAANEAQAKYGAGSLEATTALNKVALAEDAISTLLEGKVPELDAAQKAQAAYALIMEQTTTAQGDFAETSSGLANQQKIADTQWKELQTTLGTALLPVMLAVTTALNNLLTNVLPPLSAFISGTVTPTFQSIGDAVGPSITAAIAFFQSLGTTMQGTADGPMSYFKGWIDTNMPLVQELVGKVLAAITAFWDAHGDAIMTVITNTMDTVFKVIDTVLKTVMDLVTLTLQLLNGDWEAAGATMAGIVTRIWDTVVDIVSNQLDSIWTLVTDIDWLELGRSIVQGMIDGIVGMSTALWNAADTLSQNLWDRMTGWWETGSPSKVALSLGENIGASVGGGVPTGLDNAMSQVDRGMASLFDNLNGSLEPVAVGVGGGGPISQIFNFYGPTDRAMVASAAEDGVLAGLRQRGIK